MKRLAKAQLKNLESAPKGATNFFYHRLTYYLERGSMNVPSHWSLHTAQGPKVMRRGISPALARAQRCLLLRLFVQLSKVEQGA
jgi:hypothetical protein